MQLPQGLTYAPGKLQHIVISIQDPDQQRWGFQSTIRPAAAPRSRMAGEFASTDTNTQVVCQDDNPPSTPGAACSGNPAAFQYVEHSLRGTRNGTKGGVTFEFDWTPDADLTGDLTFYVAANAANGDGERTGDHIYYQNYTLKQAAASPPSVTGVSNGASFTADIAQNSWVTITGTNLSTTTRAWNAADFVSGAPPTVLDGVSVTVGGRPAYVEYISPTQVNVLWPSTTQLGVSSVVLTHDGLTSATTVTLREAAPELFLLDGTHAAAEHADGTLVTGANPAQPGEVVVLFGTGFTDSATVQVAGMGATVLYTGPVTGVLGVSQINVALPKSLADGDATLLIGSQGALSAGAASLPVHH